MPSGPRKRRAARRKKEMQSVVTLLPSDPRIDAGQHEDLIPHDSTESDCQSPPHSSAPSPYVASRPSRSSNEWFGSDAVDNVAESSTNNLKEAGLVQQDEQEVALAAKEVSLLPRVTSDAKSELFVQSEKDDRNSVEQSSVCVEKIISLQEERNQMTEVVIDAVKEVALLSSDAPEAKSDEFIDSKDEVKQPSEKSSISFQKITILPKENSPITEVATNVLEKTSGDQGLKGVHDCDVNGVVKQDGETREACQAAGGDKALPATEVLPHGPLVVNHTKWWNCCGLLDFIKGCDR